MTIDALYQLVKVGYDANIKTFSISDTHLDSEKVAKLFKNFLEDDQLSLIECAAPRLTDQDTVEIDSALLAHDFLKLESPAVSASFHLDEKENAQLHLTISAEVENYTLGLPFDKLKDTTLSKLPIENPAFLLKSDYTNDDYAALDYLQTHYGDIAEGKLKKAKSGLFFSGNAQYQEQLAWVLNFLTDNGTKVSGPIRILDEKPSMVLQSLAVSNELGPFKGAFSFDMATLFDKEKKEEEEKEDKTKTAEDDKPILKAKNQLRTQLSTSLLPEGVRLLDVAAVFPDGEPEEITFECNAESLHRLGIEKFNELLSDTNPVTHFPSDFEGLTAILLKRLAISFQPKDKTITQLAANFEIDPLGRFNLLPELAEIKNTQVDIKVIKPFGKEKALMVSASSSLDVKSEVVDGDISSKLQFNSEKEVSFQCGLSDGAKVNLTKLVTSAIPDLPDMPDVNCTELSIAGNNKEGRANFNFASNITSDWLVDLGLFKPKIEECKLTFEYKGQKEEDDKEEDDKETPKDKKEEDDKGPAKKVTVTGKYKFNEDTTISLKGVIENKSWHFNSTLKIDPELNMNQLLPPEAQIPTDILSLAVKSVEFDLNTGKKTFELKLDVPRKLQLGPVASLVSDKYSFKVTKKKEKKDEKPFYSWSLSGHGGFKLIELENQWLVDIVGTLSLDFDTKKDKLDITFKSDKDSGTIERIPVLIPYDFESLPFTPSELRLRLESISLKYEKPDDKAKDEKGWQFESNINLKFTKLIHQLASVLPEKGFEFKLAASSKGALLELKELLTVEIPSLTLPQVGDDPDHSIKPLELGKAQLGIGEIKLTVAEKKLGAKVALQYWLPEHINKLFGINEQGEAVIRPFYTYEEGGENKHALGIKFKAGYEKGKLGLSLVPASFPLRIIEDVKDDKGYEYWALRFGPESDPTAYGDVWIQKPELSLSGKKGFVAKGGFRVEKSLAIPLFLVKELLKLGGLEEAANKIPNALPLPMKSEELPQLIIEKDGKNTLNIDLLKKVTGIVLDEEQEKLFSALATVVERLPKSFTDYLKPEIPGTNGFHFELSMKSGGTIDFGLTSDPPIRVLVPNGDSMIIGTTLRGISIGTLFSGQLFSFSVDADLDLFDPITLAASLLTPEPLYKYTGQPSNFVRRIEYHNLFMLIIWQTKIPIAFPLFYDKLGLDYYGIGDITLKTGFSLTKPELDIIGIGTLAAKMIRFFIDKEYRLDPNADYDFEPKFKIHSNYLKTGEYMGSKVIGLNRDGEDPIVLSLYKLMAYMLNGLKFFDPVALLKSIPVEYRHGALDSGDLVSGFLGMEVGGKWLLVTPEEFVDSGYQYIDLKSSDEATEFMKILPSKEGKPIGKDDRGLITFLNGYWNTDYSDLQVAFGLVAISSKRFNTGFFLKGQVADLFDIDLLATLQIDPPETPFRLLGQGKTHFKIFDQVIFSGETKVEADTKHLSLYGDFHLLDDKKLFYVKTTEPITGEITKSSLALSGKIDARFGFITASGSVNITKDYINLNTTVSHGYKANFELVKKEEEGNQLLTMKGDIRTPWVTMTTSLIHIKEAGGRELYNGHFNTEVFANLMRLTANFYSEMDHQTSEMRGILYLYLLESINPSPVITEEAVIRDFHTKNPHIWFWGKLNLLPENSPIGIASGKVAGTVSRDQMDIKGDVTLKVGDFWAIEGDTRITHTGINGTLSGDLFGLESVFEYNLKVEDGQLLLGDSYLKIAGRKLFEAEAEISKNLSQVDFEGRFELLRENSLIYLGTPEPIKGHINDGEFSLTGKIAAHFVIFHATGELDLSNEALHAKLTFPGGETTFDLEKTTYLNKPAVYLNGKIWLLWNELHTQVWLNEDNALKIEADASTIANLYHFSFSFEHTAGTDYENIRGHMQLTMPALGNHSVFSEEIGLKDDNHTVWYSGDFALFPEGAPINLSGWTDGEFNEDEFSLSAKKVTLKIGDQNAITGSLSVSNSGMSGKVSGPLFLYSSEFSYDLTVDDEEVSFGAMFLSILPLPVFEGKAVFSKDHKEFVAKGTFGLMGENDIFYIGSEKDGLSGEFGDNKMQLKGGIKGRILYFDLAAGTVSMGTHEVGIDSTLFGRKLGWVVNTEHNRIKVDGNLPVLFTDFSLLAYIDPAASTVETHLKSEEIGGLTELNLSLYSSFGRYLDTSGSFSLYILRSIFNDPILHGQAHLRHNYIEVGGQLDLDPPGPVRIQGYLKGKIEGERFKLTGHVTMDEIFGLPKVSGDFTISNDEVGGRLRGGIWIPPFGPTIHFDANVKLVACRGSVYLCVSARLSPLPSINSYINLANPSDTGFGCPC